MIEIPDTPYSTSTCQECEHLSPIVKILEGSGNKVDRQSGVLHDKGTGNHLLFYNPLDIVLIKKRVNLPNFIQVNNNGSISCMRCWFNLEQRIKGKIYAGSKQIK